VQCARELVGGSWVWIGLFGMGMGAGGGVGLCTDYGSLLTDDDYRDDMGGSGWSDVSVSCWPSWCEADLWVCGQLETDERKRGCNWTWLLPTDLMVFYILSDRNSALFTYNKPPTDLYPNPNPTPHLHSLMLRPPPLGIRP